MMTGDPVWWERRAVLIALVAMSIVPLLWPALPPLTDLPGHMGRYRVELGDSAALRQFFDFRWALVGNLGVDLLIVPMVKLFGLETGTKLIVMAIPALTVAGMLWTAREAHGRVPPTALFALPLAYSWPFQLGFVNYCLAMALVFPALALWIRLGRVQRIGLRLALFVPIAWVLWIAHSFGWLTFGLFAFGAELARLRARGDSWALAFGRAVLLCLPLALPVLAMIGGSGGKGLGLGDWFNLPAKLQWFVSILRDRWKALDVASLAVLVLLIYAGARTRALRFVPLLGWPALLAALAFVLLPRLALGGAYVDMRIAPFALAMGLLALVPTDARTGRLIAIGGFTFFAIRIAATTASFALHAADQARELVALDALPRGASVLSLVARPCQGNWDTRRLDHLPGMAIVRREAFTNEQWAIGGQQLITIRAAHVAPFDRDPSQLVYPAACPDIGSRFDEAIGKFDRRGFTHVWTIGFPAGARARRT